MSVSVRPFVQGSSGAKLRELSVSSNRGTALWSRKQLPMKELLTRYLRYVNQAAKTGKKKKKQKKKKH